ncbi:MAG: hypothetical protein V4717_01920 [Bacteroidota bacterium]
MEERLNILSELRGIAPALVNIDKKMPFNVPEGYFEMLPVQLLGQVSVPAKKPAVPEGYFENLPGIMLGKIKQLEATHELENVAPALIGISRQMPYTLPANYFENLSVWPQEKEAPVISIQRNSNLFKWAIAASVFALAGFFAWQFLGNTPTESNQEQVANTTANPVTTSSELASELTQLDDASLHAALYESGLSSDSKSAIYYLNTDNFEKALRELTDEEIKTQLIVNAQNKS